MHVVIAKVDQVFFDGDAASVTAPGVAGVLTVLPHHEPLITTLKAGKVVVHQVGIEPQEFDIESGVLEVRADGATIIL
ncbi:MAG: synthase subunit epsilon [Candidatus Adlerbacteria bacterium]|nr:synthase subunit epsilon [Candidatus Adlerbacteria bacterium]